MKCAGTRPRRGPRASSGTNRSEAERKFSRVVESVRREPGVTAGGERGFGSGALKVNGRIFAMISANGSLVVKLPKRRVDELIARGDGERFETRPDRLMKEWIALSERGNWLELAREACEFVKRVR